MVKFRVYRGLLVTGCWLLVAGSYFSKSNSELKIEGLWRWLLVACYWLHVVKCKRGSLDYL